MNQSILKTIYLGDLGNRRDQRLRPAREWGPSDEVTLVVVFQVPIARNEKGMVGKFLVQYHVGREEKCAFVNREGSNEEPTIYLVAKCQSCKVSYQGETCRAYLKKLVVFGEEG